MILLHGFTGSAEGWGPVRGALDAAGFRPYALDLPGHGRRRGETDPGAFTLEATLRDIDVAFAETGPAPLVGYSMGGRIALHYALRHPGRVTHLVLESASPGLADAGEREARVAADEALARAIEVEGIEAFVTRWEALPIFATQRALPARAREEVRARRLANDPTSLAASLRGVGTGALPPLWDRLGELDLPVLLLVGAHDPKFVDIAERMAGRVGRAEVRIVDDAGHRVHLEQSDAWGRAVLDFISD